MVKKDLQKDFFTLAPQNEKKIKENESKDYY